MGKRIFVLTVLAIGVLSAQKQRSTWDGVYSADQAKRGAATYAAKCSACHGDSMGGGGGVPPVAGTAFLFSWNNKPAAELLDYIKSSMPPAEPGSLTDARYIDIIAAIFEKSGFPAGQNELGPDAKALEGIVILREKP